MNTRLAGEAGNPVVDPSFHLCSTQSDDYAAAKAENRSFFCSSFPLFQKTKVALSVDRQAFSSALFMVLSIRIFQFG